MILLNREKRGWKLKINTDTSSAAAGRGEEWTVDKKKEQWSLMKEREREKLVAQQSI